jgi:hypothetical protein
MAIRIADNVLAVLRLVCEIAHTAANFLHENGTVTEACAEFRYRTSAEQRSMSALGGKADVPF